MSKVKMHTEHTLHIQRHSEDTTYGAATLSTCRRATRGGSPYGESIVDGATVAFRGDGW